jgi:uncharacterized membrane protein YgcG
MKRLCGVVLTIALAAAALAQDTKGTLKGRVTDSSGALVPGAQVTVVAEGGQRTATTDQTGSYTVNGLDPGTYVVQIRAAGFAVFGAAVEVAAGRVATLDGSLQVAQEKQEVTVQAEGAPTVSVEASNNAGALVLRGDDLDALSDDPDDLQSDLQALAGPSAGPSGGEIYVDGFTDARLPPKASIREIRINQNPFSAEYDRLGYGRIEILTKPGTDQWHGQAMFSDSDAVFNARNPYSDNKPDFQSRQYGGNVTGPLSKSASFFFDFERREIDDNALINAIDPTSVSLPDWPAPIREAVVTPMRRTTLSPRLDYQLTKNQTLVVRYSYMRNDLQNTGLGGFSLPDQAYNSLEQQSDVQATDTMVVGPHTINETRFHYNRDTIGLGSDDTEPTIQAPEFITGGIAIGHSVTTETHYELTNVTSIAHGTHGLKFGIRVRALTLDDSTLRNSAGTFIFDSLTQYQAAVAAAPGTGVAAQFTETFGTPLSKITRVDAAPFFQDDWRARPNLTLSLGLRYETQTNIHDWHDVAPRVGFAWSPDGSSKGNGKTVVRGGFGIFYDRFSESYTLQADRFNGTTQQQFIVSNPSFYPQIPTLAELQQIGQQSTVIYQVQPGLRAPRTLQGVMSIERQLPWNTTLASTIMFAKGEHLLRSVVENLSPVTYQYQANGSWRQEQWITNVNSRINKNISLFAFYVLAKAMSDTDGATTFPASSSNLAAEWGRSSLDVRQRFQLGGSISMRWGIRLSPFITARSGAPFNITTGTDLNGDTIFNDRPALAAPGQGIQTPWGWFNPNPAPGQTIIPRNYGQSPGFFTINLRASKVFGFGESRSAAAGPSPGGGPGGGRGPMGMGGGPPGGGGPRGGGGGGGGGRGMFGDPVTDRRYNLTIFVSARSLLNNTNPGPVVGNLDSAFFGQSLSLASAYGPTAAADNRRLDLGLRFTF